jgi:YD repeat-containing protein
LLTAAGSLTLTRHPQHGLLTGTSLFNLTDARTYSSFGDLTDYNAKYNNSSFFDEQLAFDKLGRIAQKTETVNGTTNVLAYAYDQTGRLTAVTFNNGAQPIASYTYDSNNNRLSANLGGVVLNGTYDAQDRLTQYGGATYTYSSNGELKSKTINGQTTQYDYDVIGNLRHVTLPDATQIDYVIDGINRRIGK